MKTQNIGFESFKDYEEAVAKILENSGFQIHNPTGNNKGFDLEANLQDYKLAVEVKCHKRSINFAQVQKFIDFLNLPIGQKFSAGLLVSHSGFSNAAIELVKGLNDSRIILATTSIKGELEIIHPLEGNITNIQSPEAEFISNPKDEITYIGIFSSKGGVGKTTISAHLAGAMAISGYDVALIDLDPQRNLNMLLPEGAYISQENGNLGNVIDVFYYSEWEPVLTPNTKIAVCDCSPDFQRNPIDLVQKFNYCIIPTTLNPLGLNKNGHVIVSTIRAIREVNKDAYLFVLINNYHEDDTQKSKVLKKEYRNIFKQIEKEDKLFTFIPPEICSIRNSKQLFYWGYHLYDKSRSHESNLAFDKVGGKCHPKEDFLKLLDYLKDRTDLDSEN